MAKKENTFINEYGIDFREEIHIALWWRELLGDLEYLKFDQDDMMRWYLKLEQAGPDEIRARLIERRVNRPLKYLQGLDRAPHPPVWIVEAWLETHEMKVPTLRYWGGAAALVFFLAIFGTWLSGTGNLQPSNPLLMNPPLGMAPPPPATQQLPGFAIYAPQLPQVPLPTGPHNVGIGGAGAGGIPGTSPTTGAPP
jgi:hypothetical protein